MLADFGREKFPNADPDIKALIEQQVDCVQPSLAISCVHDITEPSKMHDTD